MKGSAISGQSTYFAEVFQSADAGFTFTGPVAKECADLWPRIASNAGKHHFNTCINGTLADNRRLQVPSSKLSRASCFCAGVGQGL